MNEVKVVPPERVREVQAALGHRSMSRVWPKVEIFLGLAAVGIGLFLGVSALLRDPLENAVVLVARLLLLVLGGYLTLAGHRSHLYLFQIRVTALLIEEMRRPKG